MIYFACGQEKDGHTNRGNSNNLNILEEKTYKDKSEDRDPQKKKERESINSAQKGDSILLENGLIIEILSKGSGTVFPILGETANIHYRGTLEDGTEFDSSYEKDPFSVVIGETKLIQGWIDVIPLMKQGDKWRVTVPPKLGYGERGFSPKIPPNSTLIFEMELIEIVTNQPKNNSATENKIEKYQKELRNHMNNKEYNAAIEVLNKLISLNPSVKYHDARGKIYATELNNYELAIVDFTKAIEISASDTLYYNRGLSFYKLKNFTLAVDDFTSTIDLNPDFVKAYINRGVNKWHLGLDFCDDFKEACNLGNCEKFNTYRGNCNK